MGGWFFFIVGYSMSEWVSVGFAVESADAVDDGIGHGAIAEHVVLLSELEVRG